MYILLQPQTVLFDSGADVDHDPDPGTFSTEFLPLHDTTNFVRYLHPTP